MSISQMQKVFEDTSLKGNEKLLMLALADNANDSGVSFPSWEKLMQKTSMSRGSLSKWFKKLEDTKLLFRVARTRNNGSKTSNKFLVYPIDNLKLLDESDLVQFQYLYDQSSEVELGGKVQELNYQSSEVELPKGGQSSEVELLEPSLNTLTITINHHLGELTKNERSLFFEYLDLRKSMRVKTTLKIQERLLNKYLEFGRNPQVIENAISANWKDFYPIKQQTNSNNTTSFKQQDTQRKNDIVDVYQKNNFNLRDHLAKEDDAQRITRD